MTKLKFEDIEVEFLEDEVFEQLELNELENFDIDLDSLDDINIPDDLDDLISSAMKKGDKYIKTEKLRKVAMPVAASLGVITSVGVYNPVLAHHIPYLESSLENINDKLKIDEIAEVTGIDNILLKAVLNEDGKIEFKKGKDIRRENNTIKATINKQEELQSKFEEVEAQILEENEYEEEFTNDTEVDNLINEEYEIEKEEDIIVPMDSESAKQLVHNMCNGIIHPIDGLKRGYTEITPGSIEVAIKAIDNIEGEYNREYLRKSLEKWKLGDFSNGVEVHNYIWGIQNGEIGKAGSLDYNVINEIKSKYFKNN